ncbi:MAG: Gfo/Idh/MocA family oxidoreductase, partial [FCB group bacterium]
MVNKIKFAIVGCGNIGTRHLAVVDAEPRAEIASICDIEIEKCKSLSKLYNDIPFYKDYSEMLKNTDADIINICTPHGLHAEMTVQAAEAGKNILVEKPMALTTDDANKMIEAAKTHNVKLMVVKQNRYNVPIALAKDVIESGKLGRIFMVQCNVIWNRREDYYNSSNWRGKKLLEGGSLYTHVSHFIDLMIWWFGDIVNAKTWLDTKNHNIEVEDCGTALLRFANGVMGTLLWTT